MKRIKQTMLLWPVRRKLMGITAAYLAGILLAQAILLPAAYTGVFCALLTAWACFRSRRRKSALLSLMAAALLFGNFRAALELSICDEPSSPGAAIEGTVAAIEGDYRVYLDCVFVNGKASVSRPVLVTLMLDEDAQSQPPPVSAGQRISGKGRLFAQEGKRNPGGIDRRVQALCDGYELSGYILPGWTAQGEARFSLREAFRQIRVRLLERTERLFGDRAPLFQGIMLGVRDGIDAELTAALRLTGTAHILTVSGLHVTVLAAAVSFLIGLTPLGGKSGLALLSLFLAGFTLLTGGAPGTLRACLMAVLQKLARIRGQRYDPLTGLSFAALIMTLACPPWAMHASFQFSFLAVLGIHLLAKGLKRQLQRWIHGGIAVNAFVSIVAVSAGAQIAAIPMQLMLYGYVPLLALPMNILSGVFVQLALLGGWGCLLLDFALPAAAALPAGVLSAAAGAFEEMSMALSAVKWAIVRLPSPPGMCMVFFVLAMAAVSGRIFLGRIRKAAAVLALSAFLCGYLPSFRPDARYVQLDVGQGDAAVIRKGRRAVLVDVGPGDSYDMLRYLRHEGLFVDAVLLSHLDEDHAGALRTLLASEVDVPAIVVADGAFDGELSQAVAGGMDLAVQRGIPVHMVRAGDSIGIGEIDMQVLSPTPALAGSNERSMVVYARLCGRSLLLTGDLPQSCEPVILPECDILKVAHHGSKHATSDVFVNMTQPEFALISVGARNSYGHPGKRVLDALDRVGARTLRTDESGCLTLWLEGDEIRASCFLSTGPDGES